MSASDTSASARPGARPGPGIDVRARILAALVLIAALVLTPPMGLAEFATILLCVGATTALLDGSPLAVAARALLVLPFAGGIAVFAPLAALPDWTRDGLAAAYAIGWPLILAILSKAYLSVLIVGALAATTPAPELLRGFRALGVADIFVTMLTFLLRYLGLFRAQVAAMRQAIASRAPRLRGWRLILRYGGLGGNLLVRAYERGEQVHDAMRSRGYSGTLPGPAPLVWRRADTGFMAVGLLFAACVVIYP